MGWNHNVHYHGFVMGEVPQGCQRALDVGCGRGALSRKLARACQEVVAVDTVRETLDHASATGQPNITFLHGDVLTYSFQSGSFDFVAAVATLHHLPLRNALERFRDLLRPGGTLVIVGLYRNATPLDYAFAAVAFPISWAIRISRGEEEVGAPLQDPKETLRTIREACGSVLRGAIVRRRLFFRYTVVWRKPD